MNGWIKTVIGLSVVVAVALTFAWRYYVDAPTRTQAVYKALVAEVAPTYKYYKISEPEIKPQTIGALLGGEKNKNLGKVVMLESPSELIAASKLKGLGVAYTPETVLIDYKAVLAPFEPRFVALKAAHLAPCERDDFYNQWAALRQWTAWAEVEQAKLDDAENRTAIYESEAVKYTGRPLSFAEIKAIGEAEFMKVLAELDALEERVNSEFGISLDEFALRDENFTSTPEDLVARVAPMLRRVESTFAELGDFDFAPVPQANVTAQEGLGPNLAIASYRRREDTMVIYSGEGLYNHIYDMMLVVHEIMPGHHQQLAMERNRSCGQGPISAITPFLEGWATYAEILADERGLFDAPADRLGWLDYKLVRAMRIKLDVARVEADITEEQGWALWQEIMPKRLHGDYPREWARVSNSRHHLAYITGSQAILQARETIKARLGDDFDEAEFHAALLNGHYRTMNFLTERTEAQIYARRLNNLEQGNNIETSL